MWKVEMAVKAVSTATVSVLLAGTLLGCAGAPRTGSQPQGSSTEQASRSDETQEAVKDRAFYEDELKELLAEDRADTGQTPSQERIEEVEELCISMFEKDGPAREYDYASGIMIMTMVTKFDGNSDLKMSEFWVGLPEDEEFKAEMQRYYVVADELLKKQESDDFAKLVTELRTKNSDYSNHHLNMAAILLLGSTWGVENREEAFRSTVTELADYIQGMNDHFKKYLSSIGTSPDSRSQMGDNTSDSLQILGHG